MEREFNFPVAPYEVQLDFMRNLYECLSTCKVGIFESPTGTGKSLSLICSSFKWLRENQSTSSSEPKYEGSQSWLNEIVPSDPSVLSEIENLPEKVRASEMPAEKKKSEQTKIIYLSRTHSQLDQFVNEIKKTSWNDDIKTIRLGSRNQLCINSDLNGFKGRGIIDYKCKELIDPSSSTQCPYFRNQNSLKVYALEKVCDIEDLVVHGKSTRSCPYFATRNAIPWAEVIIAPYTAVLNKRNRESIGLDLENSVLIIDEAHNIIEAMIDCYSASLTKTQAETSLIAIKSYYERFAAKLGPRSNMFFEQILHFLQSITLFINRNCSNKAPSKSFSIGDFLLECKLERMDFFKVFNYIEEIELSRKVISFAEKSGNRASISSVPIFIEFLRNLCDDISVGKILTNINEEEGIKYLLLNPNSKFKELTQECRCIVLAGGTMEPKQEYLDLFMTVPKSQIKVFSCKHVMPKENLLVAVVPKGESGNDFRFTYENRDNFKILNDLGSLFVNLSQVVPNGIVVFLPSYFFLTKLKLFLEKNKFGELIKKKKKMFFDNKEENIVDGFSGQAKSGAILFAVVRGKLSEGINFSDHLGRCVIMVGMPYLNKSDIEIQERMRYLDSLGTSFNGRMYYEASCHKAINQSIGRAIRHKGDYAVVLLVDERHQFCISKRPEWMLGNLVSKNQSLNDAIHTFFNGK